MMDINDYTGTCLCVNGYATVLKEEMIKIRDFVENLKEKDESTYTKAELVENLLEMAKLLEYVTGLFEKVSRDYTEASLTLKRVSDRVNSFSTGSKINFHETLKNQKKHR